MIMGKLFSAFSIYIAFKHKDMSYAFQDPLTLIEGLLFDRIKDLQV